MGSKGSVTPTWSADLERADIIFLGEGAFVRLLKKFTFFRMFKSLGWSGRVTSQIGDGLERKLSAHPQ